MNPLRSLADLFARWLGGGPPPRAAAPAAELQEIDIDLSTLPRDAADEVTDYDVHSLGEPVEPTRRSVR